MKRIISILSLAFAFAIILAVFAQPALSQQHKAERLSDRQLLSLISTAKTPADHQRIAQYYLAKSQDFLAQSREHAQMADQYKKNPVTSSSKYAAGTVNHCEYFAQSFKDMAAKMQELAQLHQQMAKDAEKK